MVGKVGGDLCKSHSDSTASSTPRVKDYGADT